MNSEDVLALVQETVRGMSKELGYPALATATAETELFGGSSGVDSLSVVRIVAEMERVAESRFARRVVLADERAMSRRSSPYRSVGTLAQLVSERLAE
jgi:hypothetical protein